jgi:hypothetical protein
MYDRVGQMLGKKWTDGVGQMSGRGEQMQVRGNRCRVEGNRCRLEGDRCQVEGNKLCVCGVSMFWGNSDR